jgi:hypothetical protein
MNNDKDYRKLTVQNSVNSSLVALRVFPVAVLGYMHACTLWVGRLRQRHLPLAGWLAGWLADLNCGLWWVGKVLTSQSTVKLC